ncbi:MAG: 2,3-diphosphoglycerate-dependent phosphoglycerate mutase [Armatimonadota bacterium]
MELVLIRHGESEWNSENRFTGWTDVALSPKGIEEAKKAGELLNKKGFCFDIVYTSVLKRAIKTAWIIMEEMDLMWIPLVTNWRLNERHYGALQGLNKAETAAKYGEDKVFEWRRSYDIRPPSLELSDERSYCKDKRYSGININQLPKAESLKDTLDRVIPFWKQTLYHDLGIGRKILIAAHGNSLRALIKYLDNISDEDITKLEIPTGIPIVYKIDNEIKPIERYIIDC